MVSAEDVLSIFPAKYADGTKQWLPFPVHSADTAAVMVRLLDDWLPGHIRETVEEQISSRELRKLAVFLALAHDIGKLTPVFAARITEAAPERAERLASRGLETAPSRCFADARESLHARAGEAILLQYADGSCREIASIVGAHHGKPQEDDLRHHMEKYPVHFYGPGGRDAGRLWEELRRTWLNHCLRQARYASLQDLPAVGLPAQVLLTGLLITADWIASNTDYFPLLDMDDSGRGIDMAERARRGWAAAGLPGPWESGAYVVDAAVFEERFGFAPNPVQQGLLDVVRAEIVQPGLLILEAQMGCGKTEAALAAAEMYAQRAQSGGIFFGLPTQATSDGIFGRIRNWAERQAEGTSYTIRLAHGMAAFNDKFQSLSRGTACTDTDNPAEGLIVHPWFQGRKRVLLDEFVIGTVDQLLMASLKQKHMMLRHLGLAGKVVVIDECHAYDAYMNVYLDRTLNWLGAYGVPVILLSATLPGARRGELVRAYLNQKQGPEPWETCRAYPLITCTVGTEVKSRTIPLEAPCQTVSVIPLTEDAVPAVLESSLASGGCAGVILNTVSRAQKCAADLRERGWEVLLLHSHYIAPDRAELEREILRRVGRDSRPSDRDRLVVVGTQVLEQSLDIDFDVLVTDLCPMDLLLQRTGRLHRKPDRPRPEGLETVRCYVIGAGTGELDEGSRAVYGDWLLLRTRALLPDRIVIPDQIPSLVQDTYAEPGEDVLRENALREAYAAYRLNIARKRQRAETFLLKAPPGQSRRVKTMTGLLNTDAPDSEVQGEARVRDSAFSVQVLVMQRHSGGTAGFLPWIHGGDRVSVVPSDEEGRLTARQRLTLPHVFCVGQNGEQTIRELERQNRAYLPEWQNNKWIQGELVLLLDGNLHCELLDYDLWYHRESGLRYERKGKEDAGKEV